MQRRDEDLGLDDAVSDRAGRHLRRERVTLSDGLGNEQGPRTVSTPLLKKVWSINNLERAWRVISENSRNSKSDEVKKEVEQFREDAPRRLRSISMKLSRGTFKFPPAKGVPIPKKDKHGKIDHKKFRPIVLANIDSRIVQRSILEALLTVPALQEYVHTPHSFGGIRKKTESDIAAVPAAVKAVLDHIERGAKYIVCADISKFFTRIPKSRITEIVADAVCDDQFMSLFEKAINVELSNMADLREKADAFPIYNIGIAQGSSLSPLLGNIILHDFDRALNKGDCGCVRYIDDVIILAPTSQAARSKFKMAERLLAAHDMTFGSEKTSINPIPVSDCFEFLGIEFANGLLRPAPKSQQKLIANIESVFAASRNEFRSSNKKRVDSSKSLVSTLRRVDGILQGWGKHYRFCNDTQALQNLDSKITNMLRSYIGEYAEARKRASDAQGRLLLGVGLLAQIERKPFVWPKRRRIAVSSQIQD